MSDEPESIGECRRSDDGKHVFTVHEDGLWECLECGDIGYPLVRVQPHLWLVAE